MMNAPKGQEGLVVGRARETAGRPSRSSSAPTLVVLHGAVLNRRMWDPVVEHLSADFAIAAPDLPGHGARAVDSFTMAAACEVVRETVAQLAGARVVLCGDSLGSYVALAAAPALGDVLAGAVLGGCTASFRGLATLPYLAQIALTRLVPAAALETRLAAQLGRDYAAGPGIVEAGLRPAAFAEAVHELRRADVRAALARFPAPVVLVNGTRDWNHRLGERGAMAARPDAELRHVVGAGHGVSLQRPVEFAAVIRGFAAA
jgi:pimeloyl-ACP methyl ester carboxylesterase